MAVWITPRTLVPGTHSQTGRTDSEDRFAQNLHFPLTELAGKTVLDGVSDGPWLYARLPAGSYTASATYNGHTVTEQSLLDGSTAGIHFNVLLLLAF